MKGLSGPAIPVKCSKCGGLSSLAGWRLALLGFVAGAAGAGIFLAFTLSWQWLPFVALLAVAFATPMVFSDWFPLVPITAARVRLERIILGGTLGVFGLAVAIGVLWL